MIEIQGLYWPDDVGTKYLHGFKHVRALEASLAICQTFRTAVQAGGNIGLWPRRMGEVFHKVFTFEPDAISRDCLRMNVKAPVIVSPLALGDAEGHCAIEHRSLGSHQVVLGDQVPVMALDSLGLADVDLLQLDVEGYEWHALTGAKETIARSHPVVHLELRDFTTQYGHSDQEVRSMLSGWGYRQHAAVPGNDFVFVWEAA